jgi:hypothetical protein
MIMKTVEKLIFKRGPGMRMFVFRGIVNLRSVLRMQAILAGFRQGKLRQFNPIGIDIRYADMRPYGTTPVYKK